MIEQFDLTSPLFSKVSCYGHFGSNASDMRWEQTDMKPLNI
jgi:S-adenosylmethionine synthetase